MSWIYGICGNNIKKDFIKIKTKVGKCNLVEQENIKLCYKGIDETTTFENLKDENFSIFLGLPFIEINGNIKKVCKTSEIKIGKNLDGHYLILNYVDKTLNIHNDSFGLRDLYYIEKKDYIIFSSRLDFLADYNNSNEIDLNGFSSAWKTASQISYTSALKNISRIGPGGKFTYKNESLTVTNENWKPIIKNQTEEEIINQFFKIHNTKISSNKKLTLGLSGGLDSRFLLSLLIADSNVEFYTHTFVDKDSPDTIIADKIAQKLNLKHSEVYEEEYSEEGLLKNLFEYVSYTGVNSTAIECLHFARHKKLYMDNKIIIDGGFGEILRRQFMNRLALSEKNKFEINNPNKMLGYLSHGKANIFNDEIEKSLEENVLLEIEHLVSQLPKVEEFGFKNWIDLLLVKTRLPNLYGAGQSALDNNVIAYMPFAQKNILNSLFNLSVNQRENGKFIKGVVKHKSRELAKISLVKNQHTYPFNMPKLVSHGYTLLKRKFGTKYVDPKEEMFFSKLKEFILDNVNSSEVKNFVMYDYKKVAKIVDDYYQGKTTSSYFINWWLTFEVWRQSMNIK